MDLSDAFAKVCEPLGIFNVDYGQGWVDYLTSVINTQAKAEEKPITIEDEKPSPNEGIQEFLTKLCKKYGKTILPGIDTNSISITSPNYSAEPTIPINLRLYELEDGANNNILDLQVTRDYKDVPTYAISYGSVQDTKKILQLKKAIKVTDPVDKLLAEAKATKAGTKQASTQVYPFDGLQKDVLFMRTNIVEERVIPGTRAGQAKAELAKIYRPLIISDKTAKNQKQLNNRLNRAVADRFKDAFIVEAVVKGHGPERAFIYFPDIIVNVDDRVHGVFEKMWVSGVELSASEGNSPKTKLTLYRNKSIILGED
jgi:prophage tail gpP-like protein